MSFVKDSIFNYSFSLNFNYSSQLVFNYSSSSTPEKVLISTIYWIISVFGLFLHSVVLVTVCKTTPQSQQFFLFLVNLCVADCLAFLLYVLYAAPCVLLSKQIYGPTLGFYLGLFETIDFLAIVVGTFTISINRAFSVYQCSFYNKIFTKNVCHLLNVASWTVGFAVVAIDLNVTSCRSTFLETQYFFAYYCPDKNFSSQTAVSSFVIYVGIYGVAIVYCMSIWKLWKLRNIIDNSNQQSRNNMNKYKRRLFYQAFCIWASMVIDVISFRVVPMLLSGLSSVLVEGVFVLGQSMVTPICILYFSTDIRRGAVNFLTCKSTVHPNAEHTQFPLKK